MPLQHLDPAIRDSLRHDSTLYTAAGMILRQGCAVHAAALAMAHNPCPATCSIFIQDRHPRIRQLLEGSPSRRAIKSAGDSPALLGRRTAVPSV